MVVNIITTVFGSISLVCVSPEAERLRIRKVFNTRPCPINFQESYCMIDQRTDVWVSSEIKT